MAIKCIIVDDEPLAIEVLQSYVQRVEALQLVATCDNAVKAFSILKTQPVDLLFLDIQMPKLNGIELLKALDPTPNVILTTAYRDYAIESYELCVTDYLLKPIPFNRFLMAVNKVMEPQNHTPLHEEAEAPPQGDAYLFLKADRKMVKIYLKDISHIESLKDYVRVKTTDGTAIVSLQKISYIQQKLPQEDFIRIHRSYIVPIKKIDAFSGSAVEIGRHELPIGRNYRAEVAKTLNRDPSILS